jgi:hypothetical protein
VVFAVAGLLLARSGASETDVRKAGDRLDVRATTAPLSEVLDRLARETGMKVTYDGPPPRGRVSLTLSGVTSVQAVMSVLEGQGLNFALRMDPTSTRVDTLMIVGTAGASAPAPSAGPIPRAARAIETERETEEPDEDTPPAEGQREPSEDAQTRRPPFLPQFPNGVPNGPAMPLTLPTPGPTPPGVTSPPPGMSFPPGLTFPGMNPPASPGPPSTQPSAPQ